MSDIITTNMDVDVDYSTSTPSVEAEAGLSDPMDIFLPVNRPIRPHLSDLLVPGFANDYTEAQFSTIPQLLTSGMDVSYELPTGASGAWGAIQKYDATALKGSVQWSIDQFDSVISSKSLDTVEYKVGSGIPPYPVLGDNDPNAGGTGRDKEDFKFLPVLGLPYTNLNLTAQWTEINPQFGRLSVTVTDCFGDPAQAVGVLLVEPNLMYSTNETGKVTIEMVAQALHVTSLRGSKTKYVIITAFTDTPLSFAFAGFHVTVTNGEDMPIVNTPVKVEEVGDDEEYNRATNGEGKVKFGHLKISTKYKITVLHWWREEWSGGEGIPIYLSFTPALEGWEPPPGYPPGAGNIIVYVTDALTHKPVDGLTLRAYDDALTFIVETSSDGRGTIVLPADGATAFWFEVFGLVDRRYIPFKEEITLDADEIRTIQKYLTRRSAVGGTY